MSFARVLNAVFFFAATLPLETTICPTAGASDFDGSRNLLCAPSNVVECDSAGQCERSSVEEIDLPNFVHVQFGKKRLVGTSGEERSTAIQNIQTVNGLTILQGAENGRGWSVVIDQENGRMTGSISDAEGTFSIFGACLPE